MLLYLWIICFVNKYRRASSAIYHITINPLLHGENLRSANVLLNTTADIIHDSDERIHSLYKVKQDNMRSAPFEVGYLVYTVQEKYRKMVDKFNISHLMNTRLYIMELVLYLEEIEHHYWEIKHLVNMAHEIERKYKVKGGIRDDYRYESMDGSKMRKTTPFNPYREKRTKTKKFKWSSYWLNRQDWKKRRPRPFPIDYGWEVEVSDSATLDIKELLNEFSWALKLKILKDMQTTITVEKSTTQLTTTKMPLPTHEVERRLEKSVELEIDALSPQRRQMEEESKTILPVEISPDENNMRLKLFRLMYETVRDSDLKVKRAELIQDRYTNLTSFQIGYLMGDLTDKFSIITDISTTLDRFYVEWKPIEHINAYEQIANHAIEISHLVDLMKLVGKNAPEKVARKKNK